eukprot:1158751-Pelagomonas_calceolata.AAC.2
MEQPSLQQANVQDVSKFLLQHNNKRCSFIPELIEIMLTGKDQSQADQPNTVNAVLYFSEHYVGTFLLQLSCPCRQQAESSIVNLLTKESHTQKLTAGQSSLNAEKTLPTSSKEKEKHWLRRAVIPLHHKATEKSVYGEYSVSPLKEALFSFLLAEAVKEEVSGERDRKEGVKKKFQKENKRKTIEAVKTLNTTNKEKGGYLGLRPRFSLPPKTWEKGQGMWQQEKKKLCRQCKHSPHQLRHRGYLGPRHHVSPSPRET